MIYGRRAGADEHSLLGDRGQGLREDGHAEKGMEGGSTGWPWEIIESYTGNLWP